MKRLSLLACVVLFCTGAAPSPDYEREIKILTILAAQMETASANSLRDAEKNSTKADLYRGQAAGFHMAAAMLQVQIDARRAALNTR